MDYGRHCSCAIALDGVSKPRCRTVPVKWTKANREPYCDGLRTGNSDPVDVVEEGNRWSRMKRLPVCASGMWCDTISASVRSALVGQLLSVGRWKKTSSPTDSG